MVFRARDEGLTRFVGITGHNLEAPSTFVEALRRYDFDTVMFPVNPRLWADPDYRRSAEELLRVCADRDLGVMAIKAAARRPWGDGPRFATTWYEPYTEPDEIATGVHFALSVPGVHAVCTPGDLRLLPLALDAAESFRPLSAAASEASVRKRSADPIVFPIRPERRRAAAAGEPPRAATRRGGSTRPCAHVRPLRAQEESAEEAGGDDVPDGDGREHRLLGRGRAGSCRRGRRRGRRHPQRHHGERHGRATEPLEGEGEHHRQRRRTDTTGR